MPRSPLLSQAADELAAEAKQPQAQPQPVKPSSQLQAALSPAAATVSATQNADGLLAGAEAAALPAAMQAVPTMPVMQRSAPPLMAGAGGQQGFAPATPFAASRQLRAAEAEARQRLARLQALKQVSA